ncbi:MAG: hypothetical protein AVDCRST_MAG32-724, partial [uncultured Nocardioides sp.]
GGRAARRPGPAGPRPGPRRRAPLRPRRGVPGTGPLVVPARRGPDGARLGRGGDRPGRRPRRPPEPPPGGLPARGGALRRGLPRQRRAVRRGRRRVRPRHRPGPAGAVVLPAAAGAVGPVGRRVAAAPSYARVL